MADYVYEKNAYIPINVKTGKEYQPPKRGPRKNKSRINNFRKCPYTFCCAMCGWGERYHENITVEEHNVLLKKYGF